MLSNSLTYLIFGAPGSGKGTQGRALGTLPGFFHCASGDVFRSIDTRSSLGKAFVEYSSKGQLVPDEITVELWRDASKSPIEVLGAIVSKVIGYQAQIPCLHHGKSPTSAAFVENPLIA